MPEIVKNSTLQIYIKFSNYTQTHKILHEETAGICIFVVRIEKLTTMKTCGLDVHKDMIFCAIYDGKDAVVEKFNTFTLDLRAMCAYISRHGVDTVAMESTGVYIDAIRTVLRQSGMKAVVVNPILIKQMPGRKSDRIKGTGTLIYFFQFAKIRIFSATAKTISSNTERGRNLRPHLGCF